MSTLPCFIVGGARPFAGVPANALVVKERDVRCVAVPALGRRRVAVQMMSVAGNDDDRAQVASPWVKESRRVECVDTQNRKWTFGSDVYRHVSSSGTPSKAPLLLIHTSTGLGVNRTYWNPFFRFMCSVSAGSDLSNYDLHRFDWICTGDSEPKPSKVSAPFSIDDYVLQLETYVRKIRDESGQRAVLVGQGSVEAVALTFVAKHPDLLHSFIIVRGISEKYLTAEVPEWRKKLVFGILNSPAGDAFWKLVANRRYIEGFSRKNIIRDERVLDEWCDLALEGAQDPNVRFGVFSFISGHLFGDFRPLMSQISIPTVFITGDKTTSAKLDTRMQSVRPPIGLLAKEYTFREDRDKRVVFHKQHIPKVQVVTVNDVGTEVSFERPDLLVSVLDKALTSLNANQPSMAN
ncbi:hypothetical protein FVE85_0949 [Porphyridium purpureum]|uniref:AB hydrolase-1 domain-containing protein n=1 Tax=Porphyridium purpureum TaxID=35688 RepID=A0A5J4Z1R6_PORPP|nr:hypothetical protein FVE85_0949 [Porphyridium purpureum]|eukprot:POR9287..scf208_2